MTAQHAMPCAGTPPAQGMAWIPGGTFRMGSDHHYPEEAPARAVEVGGLWLSRVPARNAAFSAFVTGMSHIGFRCAARPTPAPVEGEARGVTPHG